MNVFKVDEIGKYVIRKTPAANTNSQTDIYGSLLIVITSNEERDLPPAFIRRCIVHNIREPSEEKAFIERWREIAILHLSKEISKNKRNIKLVDQLAQKCWKLRQQTPTESRQKPSIAEFLDALRVCLKLKITLDSDIWSQVECNVLVKTEQV